MLQEVQTYIQKHQLLTPDKPIVIGVSGGTDSVALLHILHSLGYSCIIAHCNFHLRTEESNRDEQFVRKLANAYHLPYYSVDFQTTEYAKVQGISIEMAARDLRYNWFAGLLEKHAAQAIAVAHHADDSIETMLMNLTRGTGLRGLTGIAPRNKNIVRPLLCCTRLELENYLIENELDHVEDSTNALCDYTRNKVRNEILPLLTEINPSARQTMYANLARFNGTLAIYQQAILNIEKIIVEKVGDIFKMDIGKIKEQIDIPAIMYELLAPYNFGIKVIEQITEHLDSESGKIFFSETHRLVKDRNYLIISEKGVDKKEFYTISQDDKIVYIPFELTINCFEYTPDFQVSKEKNLIHIDASKITFPLTVRCWQEGDTFYPFGMKQRKKVSDFFIDNKLSLFEKEQVRLLLSGDEIVWIIGLRADNRFRINSNTTNILEFKIQ
jgi:tRNA(Ile)-lysidine synthase